MKTAPCPITIPMKTGDKLLGMLPPELRPLWSLRYAMVKRHNLALAALRAWLTGNPRFDHGDKTSPLFKQYLRLCLSHGIICAQTKAVSAQLSTEIAEIILPNHPESTSVDLRAAWQIIEGTTEHLHGILLIPIDHGFSAN